jgi:hypothetical protein
MFNRFDGLLDPRLLKEVGDLGQSKGSKLITISFMFNRFYRLLDPRLLQGYRCRMGGETPRLPERPPPGLKPGANRNKACFKQAVRYY